MMADKDAASGPTRAIRAALPLHVDAVAITDPVITLSGQAWSLTVWCRFEVTGLGFGSESVDLEDRVRGLAGRRIETFSTSASGPLFGFGDGIDLVMDEGDAWEPWVLKIPGSIITSGTRSPDWS